MGAYFAPYIDSAGLHVPNYQQIYAKMLAIFQSIYGTIANLDNSNPDVQYNAALALMLNDAFQALVVAYNGRSPATATGSVLDAIVELNNMVRKAGSASSVTLVITGTSGTVINNGNVYDTNGFTWSFATPVTIPSGGTINVTAYCTTLGPIAANPNTITTPANPQAGVTSITNPLAAALGTSVETDSQLRGRQALSAAYNSKTTVAATLAALWALSGVTRVNNGQPTPGSQGSSIENPTGAPDVWGNPAHSVSYVVEGGADAAVGQAIYNNKTPGAYTNGTTSTTATDPNTGVTETIKFFRPTYTNIYVIVNAHGLPTLTTATEAAIQSAIVNYISSLAIGQAVNFAAVIAAAMAVNSSLTSPSFTIESLYIGTAPSPTGTADIPINFNAAAATVAANITVNSV